MWSKNVLPMVCLLMLVFGLARAFAQQDSTQKVIKPDYESVDVIVETEWGTTDKTENVDVFIKTENKDHTDIVMKKSKNQECIIELVPGLVVKIVDRKTKKILKTFKK